MSGLIERQAVLDALRTCYDTETVKLENGGEFIDYEQAVGLIEELPSAQPEQLEHCPIYGGICGYPSDECYDCPRHNNARVASGMSMPSAQPERKKGKWLFPFGDKRYKKCSECGKIYYSIPRDAPFCPNCGADMKF